ncbi:MAG TPA: carboxypeptidase regulatory-like domain-containing protein [Gemmatimonadaceae bacterium]|nr:carboxypeptidase regulatory-like domain-containing protein [Gemmatimonadaceae bacterium]
MFRLRAIAALGVAAALAALSPSTLSAQGVTTGAVTGVVTDESGQGVENAQIQVTNRATGYTTGSLTRVGGRYFVQGLDVGSQYAVTVRLLGYQPQTVENIRVVLGTATPVDIRLVRQATELAGVTVTAPPTDFSPTRQGVATIVTDSVLQSLPSLGRDFTDFTKLTPQVSQPTTDAPSAGGAYNRLNNYTVDGANQNDRFNLGSSEGVPGGATGGRIISMDAVKEFQVLMSPTDVRQGNFAGMLVNAVTKSGTNQWQGGATYSYRNSSMAQDVAFLRDADLTIHQYGFQLGGPIIRDRLHIFLAPEFQTRNQPSSGPYLGAPAGTPGLIPADTIARIRSIMQARGFDVGTAEQTTNENPLTNLFGRIDWQATGSTRVVFRQLWNKAEQFEFSRTTGTFNASATPGTQFAGFRLGSSSFTRENKNQSSALQLFTNMANGASNEFSIAYNKISDVRIVPGAAPEISVNACPVGGAGCPTNAAVTFGTEQFSPDNILEQDITEITNNYTMPWGAHTITFGARFEHAKVFNNFAQRLFGHYLFANIDSLEAGGALNYSLGYDNGGGIAADFRTQQYSLYAQDQWDFSRNLRLTFGLRADLPRLLDNPAYNDSIQRRAGFNTTVIPKSRVLLSPRVGFNWNPGGEDRNQVRGNVGIFTGPPPFIMLGNAFANTGLGLVTLLCSRPDADTRPAPFVIDVTQLPRSCGTSPNPAPGAAGTGGVNITDPDFKYPQNFVTTAGFDRQLPYDVIFTFEGMYRKAINGLAVVDKNLRGPRLVGGQPYRDREGRILYADTIGATGTVNNNSQRRITSIGTPAVSFGEGIIQVTNQSADYNYTLSAQLKRRFGEALHLTAAYTYMQSKDVQSLTSDRAISNWRNGRVYAGLEDDLDDATTSYFERPHRIIAYGSYSLPWKTTQISAFYEGMSGTPFTYTVVGDLNGDGNNGNDPMYIPRDATDVTEMRIGTVVGGVFAPNPAEAQLVEDFIASHDCLDDQRGQIMERNSCRSPWQNRLDVALRQDIPTIRGQRLSLRLDIVNFLNFLNKDWGQIRLPSVNQNFPQQPILRQNSRTVGSLNQQYVNYTFENVPKTSGAFRKDQQNQANFYRMQLTLKYSF